MTPRTLTTPSRHGILLLDKDNCVSFHYYRSGGWHRKVLAQLHAKDHTVTTRDPGTKLDPSIGFYSQPEPNLVVMTLILGNMPKT